ncbi:hypothetical protein SLA2020_444160 [Shorea laevis]
MPSEEIEPLSTFLEYITIATLAVAQNMRELYRMVLVDTTLGSCRLVLTSYGLTCIWGLNCRALLLL